MIKSKRIIPILIAMLIVITFASCEAINVSAYNKQFVDITYNFDEAMIAMPDGSVISGEVESWTDFEDGDQIQVKINGITYLTHSVNVVLISH